MDSIDPYKIDGQGSKSLCGAKCGCVLELRYAQGRTATRIRARSGIGKRFRTLNKFGNETYSNFAFRLALPFNSWMDGEEAPTDINRLKEVMKLEHFTNCLPTEIHRWVVEKRPKLLVDATKLADEYAVLYKPFNAEKDNSWKSDDKNYADKTEKTFYKNWGRGNSHQKYHDKGNNNQKTAVPVRKNWAPEVLCIRCGLGGHTASLCRSRWPNLHQHTQVQTTALDTVPQIVGLVSKHPNSQLCRENQGLVYKKLAPFCVNANLCTNKGT